MKVNRVSQVIVGQEARVSQSVISQWLSLRYHGHNDKVRRPFLFLPVPTPFRCCAWNADTR